jgi:GDP-L-fucose synthase
VGRLLYLASSCAYPREAPQPLRPDSLGTGPLEPTSAPYATAKLAGAVLCDAYRRQYGCRFIAGFPANPFGPGDDFGADSGHVIPALIRRAHEAKERGDATLTVWGTGSPRREFLFSRDLASACLFAVRHYAGDAPLNLGGGTVLSVAEAARVVCDVVGFRGRLVFDATKPDGAPLKALDASDLLSRGWKPATAFRAAVEETYHWFLHHEATEGTRHDRATVPVALPDPSGRGGGRPGLPDRQDQEPRPPVDRAGGRVRRRV